MITLIYSYRKENTFTAEKPLEFKQSATTLYVEPAFEVVLVNKRCDVCRLKRDIYKLFTRLQAIEASVIMPVSNSS